MSEELVEALAKRLAHVTHKNSLYPDSRYESDWELYVDAARECVRQMAWARRSYEVHRCPYDCKGCNECWDPPPQKPLTLAPEDFQP